MTAERQHRIPVAVSNDSLSHIKDSINPEEKVKNVLLFLQMIVIFKYLNYAGDLIYSHFAYSYLGLEIK